MESSKILGNLKENGRQVKCMKMLKMWRGEMGVGGRGIHNVGGGGGG